MSLEFPHSTNEEILFRRAEIEKRDVVELALKVESVPDRKALAGGS